MRELGRVLLDVDRRRGYDRAGLDRYLRGLRVERRRLEDRLAEAEQIVLLDRDEALSNEAEMHVRAVLFEAQQVLLRERLEFEERCRIAEEEAQHDIERISREARQAADLVLRAARTLVEADDDFGGDGDLRDEDSDGDGDPDAGDLDGVSELAEDDGPDVVRSAHREFRVVPLLASEDDEANAYEAARSVAEADR